MHILLGILGVLAGLLGILVLIGAESAIHEILAGVAFIVAAVLIVGATVAGALHALREAVERADRNAWNMGRHLWRELKNPEGDNPDPGETPQK